MSITIRNNLLGTQTSGLMAGAWSLTMNSLEKLATGLKINRASDNPAGLVISEQLRSRIASLNQEIENKSALINKYQTASYAVSESRSLLSELRAMAIGAANAAGNDEATHEAWSVMGDSVVGQYNRVIESATYNGFALFGETNQAVAQISELTGIDLSRAEAANESMGVIDTAMAELDTVQSHLAATQRYELQAQSNSLEIMSQNLQAAESVLRDTDYAREFSNYVAGSLQLRVAVSLMAHSYMSAENTLKILQIGLKS